jgi:hypothetical protein
VELWDGDNDEPKQVMSHPRKQLVQNRVDGIVNILIDMVLEDSCSLLIKLTGTINYSRVDRL